MVEVDLLGLMAQSTMENSKMTKCMGMEHTIMQTKAHILANGQMAISRDMESILGQMVGCTKASTSMTSKMALVYSLCLMAANTKASGGMGKNMVAASPSVATMSLSMACGSSADESP